MKYEIEYISNFRGHDKTIVDSQMELLQMLKSIHHFDGEIISIYQIKEEDSSSDI